MRVLVLGGTAFVGRHMVEAALEREHSVTLFTRGRTNPDLYPEAEHLRGDRESDLAVLGRRRFDAVVDTSGYLPRVVRTSARHLAAQAELYVFVSSISVYVEARVVREDTPVRDLDDPGSEDVTRHYGPLKALCEREVAAAFPGRSTVIRPGLIVGRYDYTGRFGYWPRRIAAGGEVLAPGSPEARVWLLDGRDLATWTVELVEAGVTGVFNVAGPAAPLSMAAVLDTCRAVTDSRARFTWVDGSFLLGHDVVPYQEMPLWLPGAGGGHPEVDISAAIAAGLRFRPLEQTVRDVLDGDAGFESQPFGWDRAPAGIDRERERDLLAAWQASRR